MRKEPVFRRRPRSLPSVRLAMTSAVLTMLLSSCIAIGGGSLTGPPDEVGEGQVGMEVYSDPTGSTILLVPVWIGDSGPHQFVLDTGASRTLVDSAIIEELGLPTGAPAQGQGIVSAFAGETVQVDGWRMGDLELQPREIISAQLPQTEAGPQFRGLLGSDVLAGFGSVHIDYDERLLTLSAP